MRKMLFFGLAAMLMLGSCVQPQSEEDQAAEVSAESVEAMAFKDFGTEPLVIDIEQYTLQNETFRTAVWTLQPGEDIGLKSALQPYLFFRPESSNECFPQVVFFPVYHTR